MDIQWPLVLFSLIAGTGGSLFAFVALTELVGGKDKTRFAATVTVLVLIVVGGCLSMLHLASPQNAFAALTNIFSFSGISIELMLLGLLLVCGIATCLSKNLLVSLVIYMAYSVIMSIIWALLEAPDLAITEAAVGAGITGILFFLTLRRINLIDKDAEHEARREEDHHDDTL